MKGLKSVTNKVKVAFDLNGTLIGKLERQKFTRFMLKALFNAGAEIWVVSAFDKPAIEKAICEIGLIRYVHRFMPKTEVLENRPD